jgi:hypothetical protein
MLLGAERGLGFVKLHFESEVGKNAVLCFYSINQSSERFRVLSQGLYQFLGRLGLEGPLQMGQDEGI